MGCERARRMAGDETNKACQLNDARLPCWEVALRVTVPFASLFAARGTTRPRPLEQQSAPTTINASFAPRRLFRPAPERAVHDWPPSLPGARVQARPS